MMDHKLGLVILTILLGLVDLMPGLAVDAGAYYYSSRYPLAYPGTTSSYPSAYPGTTFSYPSTYPGMTFGYPSAYSGSTFSYPLTYPGTTSSYPLAYPSTTSSYPSAYPGTIYDIRSTSYGYGSQNYGSPSIHPLYDFGHRAPTIDYAFEERKDMPYFNTGGYTTETAREAYYYTGYNVNRSGPTSPTYVNSYPVTTGYPSTTYPIPTEYSTITGYPIPTDYPLTTSYPLTTGYPLITGYPSTTGYSTITTNPLNAGYPSLTIDSQGVLIDNGEMNLNRQLNTVNDYDFNRAVVTTITSSVTLTEAELLGLLNPQIRAIYLSLDPEARSLAIQLASEDSYRDKNLAVTEALRRMNDRRGILSHW